MKQFIIKMFGWMKVSNRPKHMKAGCFIFVASITLFLLIATLIIGPMLADYSYAGSNRLFVLAMVQACIVVTVAMCAVEYIQKLMGGKWDWLDIVAGCMIPILVTLLVFFFILLIA